MAWGWLTSLFTGKTIDKAMDMADDAIETKQERSERDKADLKEARGMNAPDHGTWFDALVDGISRLVRPGLTLWIIGGFIGWWALPAEGTLSDYWQNVFMLILTFWFGGRAILKDLPTAIRAIRGK